MRSSRDQSSRAESAEAGAARPWVPNWSPESRRTRGNAYRGYNGSPDTALEALQAVPADLSQWPATVRSGGRGAMGAPRSPNLSAVASG